MRAFLRKRLAVASVCSLVGVAGCGGAPAVDSGNVEANVVGTVKVDGVPVKNGELIFDPGNYQRPANKRTTEVKDGHYTIKTLTGRNSIKMTGPLAKQKPLLQQQTQSYEVKPGENTYDVEFVGK